MAKRGCDSSKIAANKISRGDECEEQTSWNKEGAEQNQGEPKLKKKKLSREKSPKIVKYGANH